MKITADLSKRVVIDSSVLQWVDSPIAGIRLLLKRDGLEEGGTSFLRYEPGSRSPRAHHGGEEILNGVRLGVFESCRCFSISNHRQLYMVDIIINHY